MESDEDDVLYEVEAIVAHRKRGVTRPTEFLIKWKGYSTDFNTWEPEENLSCPELLLEYKNSKMTTKKPTSTATTHATPEVTTTTEPKEKENTKSKAHQTPAKKKKKKKDIEAGSTGKPKTHAPARSLTTATTKTTTTTTATATSLAASSKTTAATTPSATNTSHTAVSRDGETQKNSHAKTKPYQAAFNKPSLWVARTLKQQEQQQQGKNTKSSTHSPARAPITSPVIPSSTADIPLHEMRIPKHSSSAAEASKTTPLPPNSPTGPASKERSTSTTVPSKRPHPADTASGLSQIKRKPAPGPHHEPDVNIDAILSNMGKRGPPHPPSPAQPENGAAAAAPKTTQPPTPIDISRTPSLERPAMRRAPETHEPGYRRGDARDETDRPHRPFGPRSRSPSRESERDRSRDRSHEWRERKRDRNWSSERDYDRSRDREYWVERERDRDRDRADREARRDRDYSRDYDRDYGRDYDRERSYSREGRDYRHREREPRRPGSESPRSVDYTERDAYTSRPKPKPRLFSTPGFLPQTTRRPRSDPADFDWRGTLTKASTPISRVRIRSLTGLGHDELRAFLEETTQISNGNVLTISALLPAASLDAVLAQRAVFFSIPADQQDVISYAKLRSFLQVNGLAAFIQLPSKPTEALALLPLQSPVLSTHTLPTTDNSCLILVHLTQLPVRGFNFTEARSLAYGDKLLAHRGGFYAWQKAALVLQFPETERNLFNPAKSAITVVGSSPFAKYLRKALDTIPPEPSGGERNQVFLFDRRDDSFLSKCLRTEKMDPKREAHFFCFNSRGPAFSSMPPVRRIFPKFSGGLVSTDVDNVIKNPVILNDMVGAVQKLNDAPLGGDWHVVMDTHIFARLAQAIKNGTDKKRVHGAYTALTMLLASDEIMTLSKCSSKNYENAMDWFVQVTRTHADRYEHFVLVDDIGSCRDKVPVGIDVVPSAALAEKFNRPL